MKALTAIISGLSLAMGMTATALAAQPSEWGLWHQEAGSDMMAQIEWFDTYTFWFITPITIFVMLLLVWVMLKFNARSNPNPSKTTHNTMVEVVWTVAPIVILIAIAVPSFQLLDDQLQPEEEPTLTIKATGQSWHWEYEYQDDSEISFESFLIGSTVKPEQSAEEAQQERIDLGKTDLEQYPNLLAVDNEVVVPVGEMIRVLVTADPSGVIHNWAMPAFGIKMDAIPGRVNETWFKANKTGIYYGQCSELCGKFHAYMPIAVRVVERPEFEAWQQTVAEADLDTANKQLIAAIEDKKNIKLAQSQASE